MLRSVLYAATKIMMENIIPIADENPGDIYDLCLYHLSYDIYDMLLLDMDFFLIGTTYQS